MADIHPMKTAAETALAEALGRARGGHPRDGEILDRWGAEVESLREKGRPPRPGEERKKNHQRARVGGGRTVWAGVGAYRLTPTALVERILTAREAGASGVVLFSHESLDVEALARLRAEAFGGDAAAGGGIKGSAARSPR